MKKTRFETHVVSMFKGFKNEGLIIPLQRNQKIIGQLRLITKNILASKSEILLLALWREKNQQYFPSQFKVTLPGTKKWINKELIKRKERILFFVEDSSRRRKIIGHMGLNSFNYEKKS